MVARDDQIGLRRDRSLREPLQQVRNGGISWRGWDSRWRPRLLTEGSRKRKSPMLKILLQTLPQVRKSQQLWHHQQSSPKYLKKRLWRHPLSSHKYLNNPQILLRRATVTVYIFLVNRTCIQRLYSLYILYMYYKNINAIQLIFSSRNLVTRPIDDGTECINCILWLNHLLRKVQDYYSDLS